MIIGIVVYFLNFFTGKSKNQKMANQLFNAHRGTLESQFSLVGDDGTKNIEEIQEPLIKESENIYDAMRRKGFREPDTRKKANLWRQLGNQVGEFRIELYRKKDTLSYDEFKASVLEAIKLVADSKKDKDKLFPMVESGDEERSSDREKKALEDLTKRRRERKANKWKKKSQEGEQEDSKAKKEKKN